MKNTQIQISIIDHLDQVVAHVESICTNPKGMTSQNFDVLKLEIRTLYHNICELEKVELLQNAHKKISKIQNTLTNLRNQNNLQETSAKSAASIEKDISSEITIETIEKPITADFDELLENSRENNDPSPIEETNETLTENLDELLEKPRENNAPSPIEETNETLTENLDELLEKPRENIEPSPIEETNETLTENLDELLEKPRENNEPSPIEETNETLTENLDELLEKPRENNEPSPIEETNETLTENLDELLEKPRENNDPSPIEETNETLTENLDELLEKPRENNDPSPIEETNETLTENLDELLEKPRENNDPSPVEETNESQNADAIKRDREEDIPNDKENPNITNNITDTKNIAILNTKEEKEEESSILNFIFEKEEEEKEEVSSYVTDLTALAQARAPKNQDMSKVAVSSTAMPSDGNTSKTQEKVEPTLSSSNLLGRLREMNANLNTGGDHLSSLKSIVDKFKSPKTLHDIQKNQPLDLRLAIGVNEKFLFINELFKGNMKECTDIIVEINDLSSYEKAMEILQPLKDTYAWQEDSLAYMTLLDILRRRFPDENTLA